METGPIGPAMALRRIEGIGDVLYRKLVDRFGDAAAVLSVPPEALRRAGASKEIAEAIAAFRRRPDVDREIALAGQLGVTLLA
ncbi:MAG: hypothetical protein ACREQY_13195, partial [Candidatus Binatia bacterium]